MPTKGRSELKGQTCLRGLAALTVFIAHAEFFGLFPEWPLLRKIYGVFLWNNEAVDLFFELSGFILCYVYFDRKFAWRDYFAARAARIYPLYLIGMAAMLVMNLLAFLKTGSASPDLNPIVILTNLFLVQDWPLLPHFDVINPPTWSISIEIFLYLFVLPALCLLGTRCSIRTKIVLAVLPVIINAAMLYHLRDQPSWVLTVGPFSPSRGILCFTSGFFVCVFGLKSGFKELLSKTGEILLLIVVASLLCFQFPFNRSLAILFFPALVYLSAQKESILSNVLSRPSLHWLGDISYSIYVWHWPVLKAMTVIMGLRKIGTTASLGLPSYPGRFFFIILTIGLVLGISHLSHFYFERPVGSWMKRRLRRE